MTKLLKAVLFGLLLSAISVAEAQTINAASCSQADVQTAFNAVASSTTTVNIPACSSGVAWTAQVTLTVPSGSTTLSILGAGSLTTTGGGDQTVIKDGISGSNALLAITTAGPSSYFRLAGITFEGASGGTGNPKYGGMVTINGLSQNTRADHNHFNMTTYTSTTNSAGMRYNGCTYGVVDHSIFDNGTATVSNAVQTDNQGTCYSDALGIGDQAWAHPTNLGSANFLFMENNTFNGGASNDCTYGGSFVARYNTYNMTSPAPTVQTHPTGGAGRIRGCRAWEVYNNQFNAVAGANGYISNALWISSGTGVVWGNTIPSSSANGGTGYGNFISLHSMRTNSATYPQNPTPSGWGYCGTSYNGTGSNWDQNSNSSAGHHCLDQPGQGVGQLLSGGFTSDGSGSNNVTNASTGCAPSASCAYPNQALEPIYEWMDAYSAVPDNPSNLVSVDSSANFVNNADYYAWCNPSSLSGCTSFTGASGTGSGLSSAIPSTCTTGVAYWETDTNKLYKCSATNTWTLFYTPYTYPHPLTTASGTTGTTPPAAPAPPVPSTPVVTP